MDNGDGDDWSPYPAVLAFDPGGTTGWAVLAVHPDSLAEEGVKILDNMQHWESGEIAGNENLQTSHIIDLIDAWPDAAVLFEDFILGSAIRDRDLLSPVRITAKVNYAMYLAQRPMHYQLASMAMKTATDDRLKTWGLYRREGGQGHARDATRHAITFMRRAKTEVRLRRGAWPEHYDPQAYGEVEGVVDRLAAIAAVQM